MASAIVPAVRLSRTPLENLLPPQLYAIAPAQYKQKMRRITLAGLPLPNCIENSKENSKIERRGQNWTESILNTPSDAIASPFIIAAGRYDNLLSELNLITYRDGVRKRGPLLRSRCNVGAFDRLLKSLLRNTDLPVVRVQDEWMG